MCVIISHFVHWQYFITRLIRRISSETSETVFFMIQLRAIIRISSLTIFSAIDRVVRHTVRTVLEAFCFCPCVRPWSYKSLLMHDIVQTACENFTKFTTMVQLGTKVTWLNFEVKRSEIKVTAIPNVTFPAEAYWSTVRRRRPSEIWAHLLMLVDNPCLCFTLNSVCLFAYRYQFRIFLFYLYAACGCKRASI